MEELEERRSHLRNAIFGAFVDLAEEDKGIQTHMVSAYVEYYLSADHETLDIHQQMGIIGLVHNTILKVLHANPSSLQMAHAHAYIHELAESYMPDDDDEEGDEMPLPDMLLENAGDDLKAWAAELEEYMQEKKKEDEDGQDGTPTEDPGTA